MPCPVCEALEIAREEEQPAEEVSAVLSLGYTLGQAFPVSDLSEMFCPPHRVVYFLSAVRVAAFLSRKVAP